MKVFVSGGSGFIGSQLIPKLVESNHDVYSLLRYVTGRYTVIPKTSTVFGDLQDVSSIRKLMREIQPDVVIHLAAISPVSFSYDHPQQVLEVNTLGTINLAEACRREIPHFKHFLYAGCYSEDTEVLTKDGWENGCEIQTGDLVLSINPQNKRIEWKPVTKMVKKRYEGAMIHFTGKRIDLLVTPNHRMIIETKGNSKNHIKIERAIKTKNRSVCWFLNGVWHPENIHPKTIKDIDIEDYFYLAGFYIAEGHSDQQSKTFTTKTTLTHAQYISKFRDEKTGRFLKTTAINPTIKETKTARIFFNNQNMVLKRKVHDLLKRNNIPAKIEKKAVFSSSQILYRLFDEIGHSALTKTIPRWMLDYNRKCLYKLYEGLMDGDGTKRGRSYTTSSMALADTFVELCIKLGFNAKLAIRTNRKSKIGNRIIASKHPQYTIHISTARKGIYRKNNKIVDYSGYIWCPIVKDNHTLLVRRNGCTTWCGNTSEEYGIQAEFPIEETAELRPNSPYAVSKVASDNYLQYMREAYEFPVTILRPFNTYGRKNDMHFVVERIIVQMLQNPTVKLGDSTAIRDFMYIDDHVNAYLTCLDNPKAMGQVFNFCTGYAVSIKNLVELLSALTHFNGEVVWGTIPARPIDIKKLLGSYAKAKKVLRWQPKYSLIDGLTKTIEFWKTKLE